MVEHILTRLIVPQSETVSLILNRNIKLPGTLREELGGLVGANPISAFTIPWSTSCHVVVLPPRHRPRSLPVTRVFWQSHQ
jgi:hypothetical protein